MDLMLRLFEIISMEWDTGIITLTKFKFWFMGNNYRFYYTDEFKYIIDVYKYWSAYSFFIVIIYLKHKIIRFLC